MNQAHHYKVLGVEENATLSEIKAAHRKKALKVCYCM
jgi:curved DNA-binding protein CbpA